MPYTRKNRFLDILIIALVIVNIGFYFYVRRDNQSKDLPVLEIRNDDVAKETSAPTIKKEETYLIQFFGDMMLDRNVSKNMGEAGLDYIFAKGQDLFVDSNLLIANLEGPFATKRIQTSKEIAFRFDPALAGQLREYGFDGFSLANNHSYDMGAKNVLFTRETLKNSGLGYFGDELSEGPEYTWITDKDLPFKVAFISIQTTYHQLSSKKVLQAIQEAKKEAKIVVVNAHWGEEYKDFSNKKQRELGRWLIDSGADLVIGHHPHVVQEAELYKGKPIFYSLGNFVFDQYFSEETQTGLSVVAEYNESAELQSVRLIPFVGVKSQVQLMAENDKDVFLTNFMKNSRFEGKTMLNDVIEL